MPPNGVAQGERRRRRLTQPERSAATRQALIDATIESLIELGYERSTTTEISERAGLSRGAHLHHFQTRATLFGAAVEGLARRGTDELRRGVARLPSDESRPAAVVDMVWRLFNLPLFQVVLELSVHARTDPELRAKLEPIERMVGTEAAPELRRAFTGNADDCSADDVIAIITSTVRGLATMPLLEPRARTKRRWMRCRAQLLELLDQRAAAPKTT
jgi:AcrR family transcriptional regulator